MARWDGSGEAVRWIACAGPHCPARLDADGPELWCVLSPADQPLLLFHDLQCLGRWCQAYGPQGYREPAAWPAQEVQGE